MSKKLRYVVIFLVLAIIAAGFAWWYTFRETDRNVASYKTDVTIDAASLLQAFETNEDSANIIYREKIILVTGTVGSITQDTTGYSVYLKESDAISGIMCRFDRPDFNPELAAVGSKVGIKGLCNGYLMDVVLDKCTIADMP